MLTRSLIRSIVMAAVLFALSSEARATPELIAEFVSRPTQVTAGINSGESVAVRVRNVGTSDAVADGGTWWDELYFRPAGASEASQDIPLAVWPNGAIQRPAGFILAPDDFYDITFSNITWPRDISDGYHLVIELDANQAVDEGDPATGIEASNLFREETLVEVLGGDAEAFDGILGSPVVTAGNAIDVQWSYINNGPGIISNVQFDLWLSLDQIPGNTGANEDELSERRLFESAGFSPGQINGTGTLDPGETGVSPRRGTAGYRPIIPSDTPPGTYFLIVVTDPSDDIEEYDPAAGPGEPANNIHVFSQQLTISETAYPDLVLAPGSSGPAEVNGGDSSPTTGPFTAPVVNSGDSPAIQNQSWTDRLSIQRQNPDGSTLTFALDSVNRDSGFVLGTDPSESYDAVFDSITWPSNVHGIFDLVVELDTRRSSQADRGAVIEGPLPDVGAEDNVFATGRQVLINGGDAVVTSITPSQSVVPPQTPFSLTWAYGNQGLGQISVDYEVWLSADAALDAGDINLDELRVNLNGGQSSEQTNTVTIPAGTPDGIYYLLGVADASGEAEEPGQGEANNLFVSPNQLTVSSDAFPDLTIDIATITGPTAVNGGTSSSEWPAITAVVRNSSAVSLTSSQQWNEGLIFRRVGSAPGTDEIRFDPSTPNRSGPLGPGESYVRTFGNKDFPNTVDGEYEIVIVVDQNNNVAEGDSSESPGEQNEFIAPFTMRINGGDIVVDEVFVEPSVIAPGNNVLLSWTARNAGTGSLSSPEYEVWLSKDMTLGNGEPGEDQLARDNVVQNVSLLGGESKTVATTGSQQIDEDTPPGIYNIFVLADPRDRIEEHNADGEANEFFFAGVLEVAEAFPDLQMTSLVAPSEVASGSNAINTGIVATVTNAGATAAVEGAGAWWDSMFLRPAGASDASSDIELTTASGKYRVPEQFVLAPGESYQATLDGFTWPTNIDGTYRLVVELDQNNAIDEGPGENNLFPSTATVTVIGGDVQITSLTPERTLAAAGNPLPVAWTYVNNGPNRINQPRFALSLVADDGTSYPLELSRNRGKTNFDPSDGPQLLESVAELPQDIPAGEYDLVLEADPNNLILEHGVSGETNNTFVASERVVVNDEASPDLIIEDIQAPAFVRSGRRIAPGNSIRFFVRNQGGTPASSTGRAWEESFGLRRANDPTAPIVGEISSFLLRRPTNDVIEAGESDLVEITSYDWPENLHGEYLIVAETDVKNGVFEGPGEGNNTTTSNMVVFITGGDSEIVELTVDGPLVPGQRVTATWTHRNNGPGDIKDVRFSIWLATNGDNILGDDGDVLILSAADLTGVLEENDTETESRTFTVPAAAADIDYHLIVQADPQNLIEESNPPIGENNNLAILTPDFADLRIRTAQLPSSGLSGGSLGSAGEFFIDVENVGETAAAARDGTWTDHIVLRPIGATNDNEDIVVLDLPRPQGSLLAVNDTYRIDLGDPTVSWPPNIRGSFNVIVEIDADDSVREGDDSREINNVFESLTRTDIAGGNLVITAFDASTATGPSEILTASWTFMNTGPGAIADPEFSLWLSSDGETLDRQLLDRVSAAGALEGGTSGSLSEAVVIPPDVVAGEYSLILVADPDDLIDEAEASGGESDNRAVIAPARPDLTIVSVDFPETLVYFQNFSFAITVSNDGDLITPSGASISVRLTFVDATGESVTPNPLQLFPAFDSRLQPGESFDFELDSSMNTFTSLATAVVVEVDWRDSIAESDEENNRVVLPFGIVQQPDLRVVLSSSEPHPGVTSGNIGGQLEFNVGPRNRGGIEVEGPLTYRLFLSEDDRTDTPDVAISDAEFNGTIAYAEYPSELVTFDVPDDGRIAPGEYFAYIMIDADNDVAEINDDNNSSLSVDVVLGPIGPNLRPEGASAPFEVPAGDVFELSIEIINRGLEATAGPWLNEVWLVSDDSGDADYLLQVFEISETIAPGEIASTTLSVSVPPGVIGERQIVVEADIGDAIAEPKAEFDNRAALWQITFTTPADEPPVEFLRLSDLPDAPVQTYPFAVTPDGSYFIGGGADGGSSGTKYIYSLDGAVATSAAAGGDRGRSANTGGTINANGDLVFVGYDRLNGVGNRPIIGTLTETLELPRPFSDQPARATAISADGNWIAGWTVDPTGTTRTLVWDATDFALTGATPQLFGSLDATHPARKGRLFAISADGGFAVGEQVNSPSRWTPTNDISFPILTCLDASDGSASDISNGLINSVMGLYFVGTVTIDDQREAYRADRLRECLFEPPDPTPVYPDAVRLLGDLPGGAFNSYARAVDASGTRVVGSGTTWLGQEAFIWTEAEGMRRIADMLADLGVEVGDIILTDAWGISDDGSVIVGVGSTLDGIDGQGWAVIPRRGPLNAVDLAEPYNVLDEQDVLEFVALLEVGDPSADWNGDGVIDIFDLLAFLSVYEEKIE